jgi:hypothetical protein
MVMRSCSGITKWCEDGILDWIVTDLHGRVRSQVNQQTAMDNRHHD